MLSLIPKEAETNVMKKFRPISVRFFFTEVLTNRLALIMDLLISSNQSSFIKGRYIPESVVTTHEAIHSLFKSKHKGVVLKLNYEKAFDRVYLDFLEEFLDKRGFGSKWIWWIHIITHGGFVGVKLNNYESNFFLTGKVLRQGDPLSPLLFNLVVDILTRMVSKAANVGLIKGLCHDVCPRGH